jgi:serine protease inhibitor
MQSLDERIRDGRQGALVNVTLPRMKLKDGGVRNDTLKAIGMTDAFIKRVADLTGMSPEVIKGDLFVQAIVDGNDAVIDEDGAEVAAAAGASVGNECFFVETTFDFVADHPFLLFFRDRETGVMLMMIRVMNPGKVESKKDEQEPVKATEAATPEDNSGESEVFYGEAIPE